MIYQIGQQFCLTCLSNIVLLQLLKTSKVKIHKKDSRWKCSNYRPISLLSNIDNILEWIVCNRLCKLFEDNKLIYNLQFGFRQKHSTSLALIHLTDKTCEQLDSGIVIDFHAILTQKLNYYGVRGNANNCFLHILKLQCNLPLCITQVSIRSIVFSCIYQ